MSGEGLGVLAAASTAPATPAWVFGERTWTFGELGARVTGAAAWLRALGVRPGERVAFRAASSPAALLALFAVPTAGGTAVPLHPRFTPRELDAALAVAAPARFLDAGELGAMLRASGRRTAPAGPSPRPPGTPWAVLFTSGTSGAPRGVSLPARALLASARASATALPFGRRERWLLALTPAHVGGLSILTRSVLARKTVVVRDGFDPADVLAAVGAHGVTRLSIVPAMLDALLAEDRDHRLRRLAAVIVGGAACPRRLLEACAEAGVRARTTYGLTEACSQVTLQRHDATTRVDDDAGPALPGVELAVEPDGRGGHGEGEIRVRGPILSAGYLGGGRRARGAWLETGDRGRLRADGRLVVLGRGAEMIVTGGENVAPAEVERALESCEGVRQAMVFGVPDARFGEVVAAALVPARPGGLDERRIASRLAGELARFKRPRRLAVVEALPRTPGGKPDRARAARLFAAALRPWE